MFYLAINRDFCGRVGCEVEFKGCRRSCSYVERGFFHENYNDVSFKGVAGEAGSNGEMYSLLSVNNLWDLPIKIEGWYSNGFISSYYSVVFYLIRGFLCWSYESYFKLL